MGPRNPTVAMWQEEASWREREWGSLSVGRGWWRLPDLSRRVIVFELLERLMQAQTDKSCRIPLIGGP